MAKLKLTIVKVEEPQIIVKSQSQLK